MKSIVTLLIAYFLVSCGSGTTDLESTEPSGETIPIIIGDGETSFIPGTETTLTWDVTSDQPSKIYIEASFDGGESWLVIESNISNTGSYAYQVPEIPGAQFRVRVVESPGSETISESSELSIIGAIPEMTIADNPEGVVSGESVTFNWDTNEDQSSTVTILYSTDGGASFDTLETVQNSGSATATVPSVSGSSISFRLIDDELNTTLAELDSIGYTSAYDIEIGSVPCATDLLDAGTFTCTPVVSTEGTLPLTLSLATTNTCSWAGVNGLQVTGVPLAKDVGTCQLSFLASDGQMQSVVKNHGITIERRRSEFLLMKSAPTNQSPTFGAIGAFDDSFVPGVRFGHGFWAVSPTEFYVFGGRRMTTLNHSNDLWHLDMTRGTSGQWRFLGGSQTVNPTGTYGTMGQANDSNQPGGRSYPGYALGSDGSFWVYGGLGYHESGYTPNLSDFWKYDPSTDQWTWMSGEKTGSTVSAVHGSMGEGAASYHPGSRAFTSMTADDQGNIWLYGGVGGPTVSDVKADLWRYEISTNKWYWVWGNDSADPDTLDLTGVFTGSVKPGSRHSASLAYHEGKLYLIAGTGHGDTDTGSYGRLRSIFAFDIGSSSWALHWGDGNKNQNRTVATGAGVYDAGNVPGATYAQMATIDSTGTIYVGFNTTDHNSVWSLKGGLWAWIRGYNGTLMPAVYNGNGNPGVPDRKAASVFQNIGDDLYFYGGNGSSTHYASMWKVTLSDLPPIELEFRLSTTTFESGDCKFVAIQRTNIDGNAVPVTESQNVTLTPAGVGQFHSNSSCTDPISSLDFAANQDSRSVYFLPGAAGSHSVDLTYGTKTFSRDITITPACGGEFFNSACWYNTGVGQSCDTFCGANGGVNTAATNQASTDSNICEGAAISLAAGIFPPANYQAVGGQIGCAADLGNNLIIDLAGETAFGSDINHSRICACND